MVIDIKIYNSCVKALKTDSGEQDKEFGCLFPSLSAPCTGHQAGSRRNNSEKVTIRTATVITCNFNPFSANFISWEIFLAYVFDITYVSPFVGPNY